MGVLNNPYFLLAIVLCVVIEIFISYKRGMGLYSGYETFTNLSFIAFDQVISALTGSDGGGLVYWLYDHRLFDWKFSGTINLLITFVGIEFFYYCTHWYNHHVNIGWATHVMHHSPTKYNLTLGYRLGITRFFSLGWILFLPLILFGANPKDVLLIVGIVLFGQFFLHTELVPKLGWLDVIFNTPSAHRVHHSSNPAHYNKNLGGVTLFFDHLFGTYMAEGERSQMKYGIQSVMNKRNIWHEIFCHWKVVFRQFREANSLKGKILAIFGPPIVKKKATTNISVSEASVS